MYNVFILVRYRGDVLKTGWSRVLYSDCLLSLSLRLKDCEKVASDLELADDSLQFHTKINFMSKKHLRPRGPEVLFEMLLKYHTIK